MDRIERLIRAAKPAPQPLSARAEADLARILATPTKADRLPAAEPEPDGPESDGREPDGPESDGPSTPSGHADR